MLNDRLVPAAFVFLVGLGGLLLTAAEVLIARRIGGLQQYGHWVEQVMAERAENGEMAWIPYLGLALGRRTLRLVIVSLGASVIACCLLAASLDGWTRFDVALLAGLIVWGVMFFACATDHLPEWARRRWRLHWRQYCRLQLIVIRHPKLLLAAWIGQSVIATAAMVAAVLMLAGRMP